VKARPLGRALELGDVPGPQLARAAGEQLGLGIGGMGELIAPPAGLARGAQQPVESGHRGEIATRIEQHGEHGTALMARLQVVLSQAGERGVSTHPRKPKLP
jgi:hypothetical protein